ncbi:hypothetical protein HDF16_000145 [Granulicella aggregans]|uniref:Uncharacterized protein n=1 Tax=Granulicella aggregans TaxID=474949 RepID=A0A7W7Z8Y3_9BACT|nr:hypothetical protein [Granulicella aggregans]MBB5055476.1 hypothetical protein [Granulicella aggregans]
MVTMMYDSTYDDATIRSYLLGKIPDEDELSEKFDEKMLLDPYFSEYVGSLEDDLLEEYADGLMTAADSDAMECHFLVPPERQRQLRSVLLMRRLPRLTAAHAGVASRWRGAVLTMPDRRVFLKIAAGLALGSSALFFWNQQHERHIAEEQSQVAMAVQVLPKASTWTAAPPTEIATLLLFRPGLSRGREAVPQITMAKSTARLHVSIALTSSLLTNKLRVEAEQGGTVFWFSDSVEAKRVANGAVLALDIPASAVPYGRCRILVKEQGSGETSYWFEVSSAK